jgi:hypothetical protein
MAFAVKGVGLPLFDQFVKPYKLSLARTYIKEVFFHRDKIKKSRKAREASCSKDPADSGKKSVSQTWKMAYPKYREETRLCDEFTFRRNCSADYSGSE